MTLLLADISAQAPLLDGLLSAQAGALDAAREALRGHRLVRLVGLGSSRHVAGFGAACLEVCGGLAASVLPAPGAGVPLPRFAPDQVVVVVSQSGQGPALLEVLRAASAAGATALALTNSPGSPVEDAADLVVPTGAGAEGVIPATKSVTSMMLLLRALAGPVPTAAVSRLAALVGELVSDLTTAGGRLAAVTGSRAVPAVVVGGCFAGQWVADEVALKLAETAGHLAASESLVDFLHGPAAVAAPALALLDPADPNAHAVAGRADVLTVGPSPDYSLPLGRCGDAPLDAILAVVAGQCLALGWATSLGVDPDDPRGLRKVTMTR